MSAPHDGFRPHPPEVPRKAPDEPPGLFDNPRFIRACKIAAVVVLVGLFVADFFIHYHAYLGLEIGGTPIEDIPGFYAVFGFVASVVLIFVSIGLGSSLKRKEDYYDE